MTSQRKAAEVVWLGFFLFIALGLFWVLLLLVVMVGYFVYLFGWVVRVLRFVCLSLFVCLIGTTRNKL